MEKNTKNYWKKKALSRDCSCIKGKKRDSNFNEVIDEIFDYFQKKINTIQDQNRRKKEFISEKLCKTVKDLESIEQIIKNSNIFESFLSKKKLKKIYDKIWAEKEILKILSKNLR